MRTPPAPRRSPFDSSSFHLTFTFPRLRVLISSPPGYALIEVSNNLKTGFVQPDPANAVLVGTEADPDAGAGVKRGGIGAAPLAPRGERGERETHDELRRDRA